MKVVIFLLTMAVCATSPAGFGATSVAAAGPKLLSCGLRVSSEDSSTYPHLKCMVGTAVAVSVRAMRVRPVHGSTRRLQFTRTTRFETDSGEGALSGLAVRDRVCVAYTSSDETLTARVVEFNPRTMPCHTGKSSSSNPDDGGND